MNVAQMLTVTSRTGFLNIQTGVLFFHTFFMLMTDNAYNFNLNHHVDSLGSPYDCYSVMQYDETSFSMNGKVTMQPIDRSVVQLGQEVGFTDIDADQANKLYSCNGT